jgi:hypothetical protein
MTTWNRDAMATLLKVWVGEPGSPSTSSRRDNRRNTEVTAANITL